jgi:flagellar hook-basal body complex protein FliE
MNVEPLIPDVAPAPPAAAPPSGAPFADVLDALGATLERAQGAEDAFAAKRGSLQEAIYERARADVALAVATAAAQHAAQAVQSVLNMQI